MYRKIVIGIAILSAVIVIIPHRILQPKNLKSDVSSASVSNDPKTPTIPMRVNNQDAPVLAAKATLAVDINTGTHLYEKNIDEKLPIASLTKLMTAMVVLDHKDKDQVVTIEGVDRKVDCSCMGLLVGEQITVENLLKGMLIPSNNDAAMALARFVGGSEDNFVKMMNEKAGVLGLDNTHFSNPAGLDSLENYSTAVDLAKTTTEFLKYALLERIVATAGVDVASVDGKFVHKLRTSNKLLLANSDVVGVKTGSTPIAQGNLIIKIDQNGIEVLTIVLNTPDREEETRKLIDWVFSSYKW